MCGDDVGSGGGSHADGIPCNDAEKKNMNIETRESSCLRACGNEPRIVERDIFVRTTIVMVAFDGYCVSDTMCGSLDAAAPVVAIPHTHRRAFHNTRNNVDAHIHRYIDIGRLVYQVYCEQSARFDLSYPTLDSRPT